MYNLNLVITLNLDTLQNNRPGVFKSFNVPRDKKELQNYQIRRNEGSMTTKCNVEYHIRSWNR